MGCGRGMVPWFVYVVGAIVVVIVVRDALRNYVGDIVRSTEDTKAQETDQAQPPN